MMLIPCRLILSKLTDIVLLLDWQYWSRVDPLQKIINFKPKQSAVKQGYKYHGQMAPDPIMVHNQQPILPSVGSRPRYEENNPKEGLDMIILLLLPMMDRL